MSTRTQNKSGRKTQILIVDDHPIARQGLCALINQKPDLQVCGEASSGDDALKQLGTLKPELMIVDLSMKGMDGIELVESVQSMDQKLPILVLSMHDESVYAERALRAGARGYIMKQEAIESVIDAIHCILSGKIYASPKIKEKLLLRYIDGDEALKKSPIETLSNRELQVYLMIGQGLGTREIAESLHLSVKTIETYRQHLKKKLALKNSAELVQSAIQWVISEGQSGRPS